MPDKSNTMQELVSRWAAFARGKDLCRVSIEKMKEQFTEDELRDIDAFGLIELRNWFTQDNVFPLHPKGRPIVTTDIKLLVRLCIYLQENVIVSFVPGTDLLNDFTEEEIKKLIAFGAVKTEKND